MSETPSQKPRHELTDTGETPSVPLQGGPVEVPSPARPGDDVVTEAGPDEPVALPSARPSSAADTPVAPTVAEADTTTSSDPDPDPDPATDADAPAGPTPAAGTTPPEPRSSRPAAPHTAPGGGSSDDAPTTALPVVPRPRDAAGPGGRRPGQVPPRQVPGGHVPGHVLPRQAPGGHVPGQYAPAGPRHPARPPAARHPFTGRPSAGQRPPVRFPSGPPAQAPTVRRHPEPVRRAPLPEPVRQAPLPEGGAARASGGFRLPDFPARTRPVLPAVLGAAAAVVLALGIVVGVTGTSDASPAPAPAPVSTP
ncbi:hypothetical protein [Pseudonocardia sp. ICBG601]|uniref:hypothetical protein n=1 Tax=Pseudonocardia sp. ICBG601 TaxID=2846759 RepID=UPI001CF6C2A3|nr:hypothetical protein [Pseudonocardia sp. ICBG601]